jgi:hypothetical protein
MDLLTDDVTVVKPFLEPLRPTMEDVLGPVSLALVEGHYCAVDIHGNVFKVWVNPASKRMELEQL